MEDTSNEDSDEDYENSPDADSDEDHENSRDAESDEDITVSVSLTQLQKMLDTALDSMRKQRT